MTAYPLEALAPLAERLRSTAQRRLTLDADDLHAAATCAAMLKRRDTAASVRRLARQIEYGYSGAMTPKIQFVITHAAKTVEDYTRRLQR